MVKCLPGMHKALGLIPSTRKKKERKKHLKNNMKGNCNPTTETKILADMNRSLHIFPEFLKIYTFTYKSVFIRKELILWIILCNL
jgi:hypothetical protein